MLAMKNPQAEKVPFSHLGACGVNYLSTIALFMECWFNGKYGLM